MIDYNNDGVLELLIAYQVRETGFVDAYKGQKSRIAVIPLPAEPIH